MTLREAIDFLMNDVYIEDYIYDVREREGKGWEGPRVKKFADSCDALKNYLKEVVE